MPDPVTHYTFGKQVFSRLPSEIQQQIDLSVYERALQGPDPWSDLGFWGGKAKQYAVRSGILHTQKTGLFLQELMRQAQGDCKKPVFSLLAGFLCHYCLDKTTHPYIICKGGVYDGTKTTRHLRGGHVRLERSIDSYYIRRIYKKTPWRFSLAKNIFKCKRYPESLREPLDTVFKQVYNWENGFDLFNRALHDERLFYSLMQDPCGIVHYLLRLVSFGSNNYCLYSYYRRETDSSQLDYLNEKHLLWHHPFNPNTAYTDSFLELFEQATAEALRMIAKGYDIIFASKACGVLTFGEFNYSTGLPCEDERNSKEPVCEPLIYKNQYKNQ